MSLWFYIGALAQMAISGALFKVSAPYAPVGASQYGRVRFYRLLGKILLVTALLSLGIGAVSQIVSNNALALTIPGWPW
jgi:hypothetical protein